MNKFHSKAQGAFAFRGEFQAVLGCDAKKLCSLTRSIWLLGEHCPEGFLFLWKRVFCSLCVLARPWATTKRRDFCPPPAPRAHLPLSWRNASRVKEKIRWPAARWYLWLRFHDLAQTHKAPFCFDSLGHALFMQRASGPRTTARTNTPTRLLENRCSGTQMSRAQVKGLLSQIASIHMLCLYIMHISPQRFSLFTKDTRLSTWF
jgi:hypothetical protein